MNNLEMKNMEKLKVLWEYLKTKMMKNVGIMWEYLKMKMLRWWLKLQGPVVEEPKEVVLKMDAGAYYLPKANQGEDAHFVCAEEQTIGVADGVGAWASEGVDAGEYSRELTRNSKKYVRNQHEAGQEIDPRRILEEAYTNTKHIKLGSSTVCIVTLKNTKDGSERCPPVATLHAVNIGDSGFIVFRKIQESSYKLKGQSVPQQKGFNFPYQLGNVNTCDNPDSANDIKFIDVMEAEDVMVLATDGLFDNVFRNEIEDIINLHNFEYEKPEELAERLGRYAAYNPRNHMILLLQKMLG